jgi:hypothetical protein
MHRRMQAGLRPSSDVAAEILDVIRRGRPVLAEAVHELESEFRSLGATTRKERDQPDKRRHHGDDEQPLDHESSPMIRATISASRRSNKRTQRTRRPRATAFHTAADRLEAGGRWFEPGTAVSGYFPVSPLMKARA